MLRPAETLTPDEALALVAGGLDREALGPFAGHPAVVVEATAGPTPFAALAPTLPCVAVTVGRPGQATEGFDVCLTDVADPPPPWVTAPAAPLVEAIGAAPEAAVALVQLLRLGRTLDLHGALVAESVVYGLLQGGVAHRAWLAAQPPRTHRDGRGEPVRVERRGDRLLVTLARPEARNAFDVGIRDGLAAAFGLAAADAGIAAVEVRGEGPSFCAGGDLSEFGTVPDPVTGHLVRTTRSVGARLAAVADRVTVHVHGPCVGAGVEVPAFAGRVVAADGATFRLPEVAMGLVPGAGGTASIPRRIGPERTAWLALTGHALDAGTALAWHLVDAAEG